MIFAFLSSRIRTWVIFALLLPLGGRVLQALGVRVGQRNERAGRALSSAGGFARDPRGRKAKAADADRRRAGR